ncbi:MAG TPA: DnaJ domain-containing protein, partial [Burkholderiales bacterium]
MEESTDLYAILGVLPNAEDVVIRAAYRILSQRYHPDRYKGDPAEGAVRLKRIEEAYAVLSDPARRRQYDQEAGPDAGTDYGDKGRAENLLDAPGWRADWELACRFYPALRDTEAQFRAMSPALAFTFCASLLETKRFPEGEGIARQLEQAYLGKSFGDNPEIVTFAKRLIVAGNNEAVRTLKQALKVLGSSTPAAVIIDTLTRDFLQAPAEGAREPESEPEPEPAPNDAAAWEPAAEEPPPDAAAAEEQSVEQPAIAGAPVEEPVIGEPTAEESAGAATAEEAPPETESAAAPEEGLVAEAQVEKAQEEVQADIPEPATVQVAEKPESAEPVDASALAPPPPKPAPAVKAAAKHVFKDSKKRASAQSVLRAFRAGESLDLDSAVTLVKAMDGAVNLKRADAQFGDLRVEVKFRGQNIMFSSGE